MKTDFFENHGRPLAPCLILLCRFVLYITCLFVFVTVSPNIYSKSIVIDALRNIGELLEISTKPCRNVFYLLANSLHVLSRILVLTPGSGIFLRTGLQRYFYKIDRLCS